MSGSHESRPTSGPTEPAVVQTAVRHPSVMPRFIRLSKLLNVSSGECEGKNTQRHHHYRIKFIVNRTDGGFF